MKSKQVVKYRQGTVRMFGKVHKQRYKMTLLATIKGPEAIALTDRKDDLHWSFDGKDTLRIYAEELL